MKTYEGIFIFLSSMKEDAVQKAMEQIQAEITKLKGTIKEVRVLGRRQFARPMKKQDSGQYVRIDFQMAPDSVSVLLAKFKMNESIFRLQLIAADEIERNYSRRIPAGEDGLDGIS